MKRIVVILIMLLFSLGIEAPARAGGRLQITASILPIWIFTKNVVGESADVSLLVPPGVDVHEYSLTPRDVRKLHNAKLLVISGSWVEPFLDRIPHNVKVIEASEGYATPPADPHFWLDPVMAQRQVETIAKALERIDPQNKNQYEANAQAYIKRLGELNETIAKQLAPLEGMPLITYHEAFTHFAGRYGLIAYSLTGPHAESPLPQRVRQVYDVIRQKGVQAVFSEEQYPPDIMKRLTSDLGVKICSLSTVTTGKLSPDLYEQAMKENVMTILRCLGKEKQ